MPIPRHYYRGEAFEALRITLRTRSGNACEHCKVPNDKSVFFVAIEHVDEDRAPWFDEPRGRWITAKGVELDPRELQRRKSLLYMCGPDLRIGKWIDVVCGVAHLDHDPSHQDPERCAWLCARCHFAHDRRDNLARRRRYEAEQTGQLWLQDEIKFGARPEARVAGGAE